MPKRNGYYQVQMKEKIVCSCSCRTHLEYKDTNKQLKRNLNEQRSSLDKRRNPESGEKAETKAKIELKKFLELEPIKY